MADITKTKRRLVDALKDKVPRYWELMKHWYKRKISKDEFDVKVKSLLGEPGIQLHNEFLFAILVKCQTVPSDDSLNTRPAGLAAPPEKKAKLKSSVSLTPFGVLDPFQYSNPPQALVAGKDLDTLLLCSHELLIPDMATMHTRLLLGAWEAGLEEVDEEAAVLVLYSLQNLIKTVITEVIAQLGGWTQTKGGFRYGFGHGFYSDSSSAHEIRSSDKTTEAESVALTSQKFPQRRVEPITLFHIRNMLQVQSQCIPRHSVRSCWKERVLGMLWHLTREEEEHKHTVTQWQNSLPVNSHFCSLETGKKNEK